MTKRFFKLSSLVLITMLMFISCASSLELAQKALGDGNYTKAISQSIAALNEDPNSLDAKQVLDTAWKQANQEWMDKITFLKSRNTVTSISMDLPDWVKANLTESEASVNDLDEIISLYDKLIQIHILVENANYIYLEPNSKQLMADQNVIKQQLAEIYFTFGKEKLSLEGRENAKEALNYFTAVKKLVNNYPNIEEFYEQAVREATVKLAIIQKEENSKSDLVQMIKAKYSSNTLIDIVYTSNTTSSYQKAVSTANKYDADILIFLDTYTTTSYSIKSVNQAVNYNVTGIEDWDVKKTRFVVNGEAEINYMITDLNTNQLLSSDTISLNDGTDFGFSFSYLDAPYKNTTTELTSASGEKIKIKAPVATVENNVDFFNLEYLLNQYEGFKLLGNTPALWRSDYISYVRNLDFDSFTDAKQLSYMDTLNNHTFIPFLLLKSEMGNYYSYQYTYYGADNDERKLNFDADMYIYEGLMKQIKSRDFVLNTIDVFLDDFNEKLESKLISKISPYIK